MKVSIVIPVYNEAVHLRTCLEAISRQTVLPYEVLVVDNNSADGTVAIAESFAFVTVLHEPLQGVVYARDQGFDAASGDIIGRIDADSLIDPSWVASLQKLYTEDAELMAVTGKVHYYGLALEEILNYFDLKIRRRMARLLGREVAMQGANMAVRRSAWLQVRNDVCRRGGLHEDHDIAIHLTERGLKVSFDERLVAAIDCRRLESSWREFCHYAWLSPKTYAEHSLKSQRHMYPVVGLVILCYPALKFLHRGYDTKAARFSWRQLFVPSSIIRVNPATFVD